MRFRGLVFWIGERLKEMYRGFGIDLARFQGNGGWFLPIPATLVVGRDGRVKARFDDPDFRHRMNMEDVLRAVRDASRSAATMDNHGQARRNHHWDRTGRPIFGRAPCRRTWMLPSSNGSFLGWTCVNTGCIPTKTLVASAYAAHLARRAADYGVTIGGAKSAAGRRILGMAPVASKLSECQR